MKSSKQLKIGAAILAIGALGLSGATFAIYSFAMQFGVKNTTGRLLIAGALANQSLSFIMSLIAAFPLRRGEKWAFWAYALPFGLYGIPIMVLDATNVAKEELVSTLTPQILGLIVALLGLFLVAPSIFKKTPNGM